MYARRRLAILSVSMLATAMLWGCGSNGSGGSSVVVPSPDSVQTLGIDNCFTCHGVSIGEVWTDSVHGNLSDGIMPTSPLPDNPNDPVVCSACHDPLADGARLAAVGQPVRPVIGCESCHGGGSAHRGVGLLPYPDPDRERCGQCHNASYEHSAEGDNIVEDFRTSPHANSLDNPPIFDGNTSNVRARCSKCHTDEGAKLYRDVDGDYTFLTNALPNSAPPLSGASPIECRTCHQAHNEGELLEAATPAGFNLSARSSEFNTCTNCHQLFATGSDTPIVAYHDPAANPFGALDEIITDTHLATPGNFVNGTNVADITGYAFDYSDPRACRNCHNVHSADITINEEWAESGHADKSAAGAWAHYNWTEIPGAVRNDGTIVPPFGDRRPCQRCHTTTGVIAYLVANADANPSDYVAPLAYDANFKPEMLKCNGCHSNNVGGLRSTGRITADYTNAPFQYPNALSSNLCLACHTGRESGESIKNDTDADGDRSFINSHYLTAGGTIYTASGYEYAGLNYNDPSFYAHKNIGMGTDARLAAFEAVNGTDGPCIGCHLSSPQSHLFLPVTKDEATGAITAITSTVCVACHSALTPAELTAEEEDFQAALDALNAALARQGIYFFVNYPYFFTAPNGGGDGFTNWDGVAVALGLPAVPGYKDVMGAAFNFNLLAHDPGAYAHNRFYAKRLIFDSIDFIFDGVIDGNTGAAIDALVTDGNLDATVAEVAKAYLDGDGATAGIQRR